jgi:hypothetical protein
LVSASSNLASIPVSIPWSAFSISIICSIFAGWSCKYSLVACISPKPTSWHQMYRVCGTC